jgi:acyl carrier protein
MELDKFISDFADLFEETDPSDITSTTLFHELDEWDSLVGLCLIGMAKANYGKTLTGDEIKKAQTVQSLYEILLNK